MRERRRTRFDQREKQRGSRENGPVRQKRGGVHRRENEDDVEPGVCAKESIEAHEEEGRTRRTGVASSGTLVVVDDRGRRSRAFVIRVRV